MANGSAPNVMKALLQSNAAFHIGQWRWRWRQLSASHIEYGRLGGVRWRWYSNCRPGYVDHNDQTVNQPTDQPTSSHRHFTVRSRCPSIPASFHALLNDPTSYLSLSLFLSRSLSTPVDCRVSSILVRFYLNTSSHWRCFKRRVISFIYLLSYSIVVLFLSCLREWQVTTSIDLYILG